MKNGMLALACLTLLAAATVSAQMLPQTASAPRSRLYDWNAAPPAGPRMNIVDQNTLVFPDPAVPKVTVASPTVLAVSQSGNLALTYNRESGAAAIYGPDGKSKGALKLKPRCLRSQISDAGMIILYGSWVPNNRESSLLGQTTVYDPEGHTLCETGNLVIRSESPFSPDGRVAAFQVDSGHKVTSVLVNMFGQITKRESETDFRPMGVKFHTPSKRIVLVTAGRDPTSPAALHPMLRTDVQVFDVALHRTYAVRFYGTSSDIDAVALSPDGQQVAIAANDFIAVDRFQNPNPWQSMASHLELGNIPVTGGVACAFLDGYVIAAHRAPTGKSYRYVIHVFDAEGNPVYIFPQKPETGVQIGNGMVTPEAADPRLPKPFWDVLDDHTLRLNVEPKTTIKLPPHTGKENP